MSKFVPSPEQQLFIETLDKNVLVSASAGSGKTSTMVEKILQIVKNGVDIDNMLIITYTVASANEMKQRLRLAIVGAIRESDNEDDISHLYNQLEKLNNCDIGTIHSICKKIISKYFYVIDQDVNFGIVEQSDYLYDSAIKKVFKKYISSDDPNFFELYESYNKKRNDKTLVELIKKLHDFFNSKLDPDSWKEYVLNVCYDTNVGTNICANYILDKSKRIAHELINEFKDLLDIKIEDKFVKLINNRLDFLQSIESAKTYDNLLKILCDATFINKVPTKSLDVSYSDWILKYERANNNFKVFKEEIMTLKDYDFDVDELKNVKGKVQTLFNLIEDISLEYTKLKDEQNLLDFSDLEHKTLKILNASEDVCSELKNKYDYIFVDEYQDINEMQEGIINKIKRENNLNLIGDVKQSIFAFRLATPKLFIDKYNTYPKGKHDKVVKFNQNFRSKNNILQFVNWVCNEVITTNTIGIDYKSDAQLIYPEVKGEDKDQVVEISIIDKKKDDEAELENDEKEALLIVKKIKDIICKSYKTSNGFASYTYKDIAIISRNKTTLVGKIISALKQYNIPCNVMYKSEIFNCIGVQILYSYLKLLNNSNDALSIAILLKNIYGLTENDLAKIMNIGGLDFCDSVKKYVAEVKDDHISNAINLLYHKIDNGRFKLSYMSLHDLIKEKADDIKLELLSRIDGRDLVSQIDEFLSLLDNNLYKNDIKSCIDYLGELQGTKTEIGDLNGDDAVTITTIHSSKGLEYKAVIFCGLGGVLGINKHTSDIVLSDKYGVGLQYLDTINRIKKDTFIKKACLYDNEHEQVNEELRLLYVALTRGMQYLVLTGVYDTNAIVYPSNKGIYSGRKFFDWIFRGLSSVDRSKFSHLKDFYINEGKVSCAKIEIDALEVEEKKDLGKIEFVSFDESLKQRIENNLSWKYPFVEHSMLPIKNSVSSILAEDRDYENKVDAFKELSISEKIKPSESIEKGNAYHRVMQSIDFNADNDIDEIIRVCDTYGLVDSKKIKTCIEIVGALASNCIVQKEAQFLMKIAHSEIVENGENQKILVQGIVDLFLIDDDGITLIDYKTNRVKDVSDLASMYATQMKLYTLAIEKSYKKKVKNVYLYSFDKDMLVDMKNYIK